MLFGRVARITFDIVGTLVVLLLIGAGLLGWRLSTGPLSLKFMTPLIERALSDEAGTITVDVDDTVLAWGGGLRNIDLRVRGVRAVGSDGHLMLELPEVAMSFSMRALLRGMVAPASLDAIGAQLVLTRAADGAWHLHAGENQDDSASALSLLLDDLLEPPDPGNRLGYLRSISVYRASLTVVDESSGHVFVARDLTAVVARDAGGLRGRLTAVADISGSSTTLTASGRYASAGGTSEATLDFANLDPTTLATVSPTLAPLAGFNVKLSGRITANLDSQFRLAHANFELRGNTGRLEAAPYNLPAPAVVRRLQVRGNMPNGLAAVDLDEAEIDLNGPVISLRGRLSGLDAQPQASGVVVARNVPTDDLDRLWPRGAGANARKWVTENLAHGTVGEARAEFSGGASASSPAWALERLSGSLRFAGVEVNYLSPMPHIQGVDGEAKFTKSRFDITTTSGTLGNLHVPHGSIALTALDTDNETADIDVQVEGPLREALDLADGPPLGYLKKIDLTPDSFSGDAAIRLALKFPLKKTIRLDELEALVTAEVHRLTQRRAALGQDITNGDVNLRIDREGMNIAGRVMLGPAQTDVDIRRNFSERAPIIGRSRARARLAGADDLAAFGFDVASYVQGPADLAVDYIERRSGLSDVTVDAKLDDAALTIPQLEWTKPAHSPATAHVVIDLAGGRAKAVRTLALAAGDPARGGLSVEARLDFDADGKTVSRFDFDTLKVGLTDAHGSWARSSSGISVDVAGAAFNAAPFMKDKSTPRSPDRSPLALHIEVDRLYLTADRSLNEFQFRGQRGSERWESADLVARTGDGTHPKNGDGTHPRNEVALALQSFGDRQKLDMVAEDAGAFLKAVDITPNVSGGRLEVTGATDERRPDRPLAGHLHMSAYRVTRAPILARVLSVAFLTGILDSLTGEGIRFAQLDTDFIYDGSRIEVINARSAGPAIGVTARGVIDTDADTIDLTGTVVPANALNSLPGKIPIIGDIFTGGGGGVFAATYKIIGPMSDPKASVNPLATLAPGFLRNLFRALPGVSSRDSTPESEKEIQREQPKVAPP